jgi:hypothetical protein
MGETMGIEEDRVELTGTDLDKALFRLGEIGGGIVSRGPDGKWKIGEKPPPGGGDYYEAFPSGELRRWFNRSPDDADYQLVKRGK